MEHLVATVNESIRYPRLRAQIRDAVAELADADGQRRTWLAPASAPDGLDAVVHVLFDDTDAATRPGDLVGDLLFADEVEPLRALGAELGRLIDDLGDVADRTYLDDPRWPQVVAAARRATQAMAAH